MSWEQVECTKCGQPMGDHAGLFVEGKPWHTACHYNVLTARLAAAEDLLREAADAIRSADELTDEDRDLLRAIREALNPPAAKGGERDE